MVASKGMLQPHTPQSVLALDIAYKPTLADVHFGANGLIHSSANEWLQTPSTPNPLVLVWGGQGVGKTVLCHALVNQTQATYLSPAHTAHSIAAACSAAHIVIDDIEQLNPEQARAAFDVFNHCREHGKRWWATSRLPPAHMHALLPDLASRLAWGLVLEMLPLGDDDSVRVLQAQATRLGFELPTEAAHYLLLRLERNHAVLAQHLGSLNHYLLSIKKPLNTHWVQQWYSHIYQPTIHPTIAP